MLFLRSAGLAVTVTGVVILGACTSTTRDSPDPDRPISTNFYCPGNDRSEHCYLLGDVAGVYCIVQQARAAVRAGRIDVDDLPAWSDRSDVDGAPRIVDFREGPEDRTSAQSADEVAASMRDAGIDVDLSDEDRCADRLSAPQIARTEEP